MARIWILLAVLIGSSNAVQKEELHSNTRNVFPVLVDRSAVNESCPSYHFGYQFNPYKNAFTKMVLINSPPKIDKDVLYLGNYTIVFPVPVDRIDKNQGCPMSHFGYQFDVNNIQFTS